MKTASGDYDMMPAYDAIIIDVLIIQTILMPFKYFRAVKKMEKIDKVTKHIKHLKQNNQSLVLIFLGNQSEFTDILMNRLFEKTTN